MTVVDHTDKVFDDIHDAALAALERVGQSIRSEAIRNVSGRVLKRRSGDLANMPPPELHDEADPFCRVGTNKVYGRIHELGGTISAKKARALFFEIDGHFVMKQSVKIPKRPWLRPAGDKMIGTLPSVFSDECKKRGG